MLQWTSQHKVVLRIQKRMAKKRWKSIASKKTLASGTEHNVTWKPYAHIKVDSDLPSEPIQGRLIYVHIQQNGFRPMEVYLFTTLLDDVFYPLLDICDLYSRRWQVEIDLRQVKTTLPMEQFEVKSAEMSCCFDKNFRNGCKSNKKNVS